MLLLWNRAGLPGLEAKTGVSGGTAGAEPEPVGFVMRGVIAGGVGGRLGGAGLSDCQFTHGCQQPLQGQLACIAHGLRGLCNQQQLCRLAQGQQRPACACRIPYYGSSMMAPGYLLALKSSSLGLQHPGRN